MYYLSIAIIILLLVVYYYEKQAVATPVLPPTVPAPVTESFKTEEQPAVDWTEQMKEIGLEKSVVDSNRQYVSNVRNFGTGANFAAIADDNISPLQTNFLGFSRPAYVEIKPGARTVPDIDPNVFKRNKRLTFVNDYGLK